MISSVLRASFRACLPVCFGALSGLATGQQAERSFVAPEVRGGTGATAIERVLHVTYDVRSDRLSAVRASTGETLGFGSTPCFDNSLIKLPEDPQYVVALIGQDLQNWGDKFCPGASLLRSFTFAYRSEADDRSIGGPGAAFSVALYQGTDGWGATGTEVFRRTFTGMPSNGAPASGDVFYDHDGDPFWTGPAPMVFVTVDFGLEPVPLADGDIGWSFLQLDGDTGPVLVRAPRPLLGTVDAMDIYTGPAEPAGYVGTFNYGGCGSDPFGFPCANMYLQLDEITNAETALTTVLNGSGVNPVRLSEVLPARLGGTWAASVSGMPPAFPGNPPTTLLFLSAAARPATPTPWGELLIDPTQRLSAPLAGEGGYALPVPADVTLAGISFYAQVGVIPPAAPALALTNALRVRMGF
jgi:hypothetical protein